MQNEESQKIVERFFEVLYDLKRRRVIRGKQTFTRKYGINNRNFWQLEQDKSRDMFQLEWLAHLVRDYFASATWLLTGEGKMYTIDPDRQWRHLLFRSLKRAKEWELRHELEKMREEQNEN
ncbi:MAG: hypothetical protein LBF67_08920 [Prevotellaceae bacterium]|jgi:hypothetical protein|nr:hypothetical protein [Prevotellaceae bacterium]